MFVFDWLFPRVGEWVRARSWVSSKQNKNKNSKPQPNQNQTKATQKDTQETT